MRLYRTTCALPRMTGYVSRWGSRVEAALRSRSASDHRYGSIVLPELVRSRPFGRLKL